MQKQPKKVPGVVSVLGRRSGAKRSGPIFRLRVCLSWAFLGGPKGPDALSGLGSACVGSGCTGLCFFWGGRRSRPGFRLRGPWPFGGPKGPDPLSGLGSACLGSGVWACAFLGGQKVQTGFWLRVCLPWGPGLWKGSRPCLRSRAGLIEKSLCCKKVCPGRQLCCRTLNPKP